MSIIIAYRKDNVVYLGTDTRRSINEIKGNDLCECDYKIQKCDGGLLLGVATEDQKLRQTLFAYSEIFTLDKKGALTKKHIVTVIIPALIEVLKKENLLQREEKRLPEMRGGILLAHRGNMYEICSNFALFNYRDYQGIGTPDGYAQYALASAGKDSDPNEVILQALKTVAKHNCLVGSPYLLIDTKSLVYTLVGGEKK